MEQKEFEALVKRLEEYARAHPRSYNLRVGLLAAVGYSYLILVLTLLLVANVALAVSIRYAGFYLIKALIALVALTGTILRALWVRMPQPEGVVLNSRQAPVLFKTIKEIRSALKAPKVQRVVLSSDFNAGVVHTPRLGVLGWPKRHLVLGLTLMQALSPSQFRAVLAHEFGHVSGHHGRFASWIYRIRQTWIRLLQGLESQKRWGSFIFVRFSRWYAPWFNAYSFVLARAHEYEADRCAAEVTSARDLAEALIAMQVKGAFLAGSFWPTFWKQVEQHRDPPTDAISAETRALSEPLPPADASKWLAKALRQRTEYDDTHPCLADRLSALGYPLPTQGDQASGPFSDFASPLPETAAQCLVGGDFSHLLHQLNDDWQQQVRPQWRDQHDHLREVRQNLDSLEEKAKSQVLSEEETWNRTAWTLALRGGEATVPLLQEILAVKPDHASANYTLGQILLARDDARCVSHLESAMARDPFIVIPGCQMLGAFFAGRGQEAEVEKYRQRAEQQERLLLAAQKERQTVTERDPFEPHQLTPASLARLSEVLSWFLQVERVYLARKTVRYIPEIPYYVLGIVRRRRWIERDSKRLDAALSQMMAAKITFEGNAYFAVLPKRSKMIKALSKVPGAEVYSRPR